MYSTGVQQLADTAPERLAVEISKLTKCYPLFRSPKDGILFFLNIALGRTDYVESIGHVRALNDISFTIRKGERVGVVGRNGSGKSTLLNILAGSLPITRGHAAIRGQLYTLASGLVGFDPLMTARQNSERFLLQYGYEDEELASHMAEIENFVELGEYFDQPLQTYSLGMRVRAEFAAATAVDADIIQIDEVLGAGDAYWAEKCAVRMQQLCDRGKTMILVSHSVDQLLRYCSRVIWLDSGRVVMDGDAHEVLRRYELYLEKLSWETDDIDDRFFNVDMVETSFEDIELPASGTSVMRWPGQGRVEFTGIWFDGDADVLVSRNRSDVIRIKMNVRANETGDYRLRYLVSLRETKGKVVAIVENDIDFVSLVAGDERSVYVDVEAGQLGAEDYIATFSLFHLGESGSSASEKDSRQDVIYKSFTIRVMEEEGHRLARFGVPMSVETQALSMNEPDDHL